MNLHQYSAALCLMATLSAASALAQPDAAPVIPFSAEQIAKLGITLSHPRAANQAFSETFNATVIVAPDGEWVATAPSGGVIERVPVSEGQRVRAREVLVQLRSPETPQLAAELAQAESAAQLAQTDRDRDRQLLREGIISAHRAQVSDDAAIRALTTREALRSHLRALDLSIAEARSGNLQIRAPLDAIVLERLVTPGQRVNEADALVRLADPRKLMLELHLPAAAAPLRSGELLRLADGRAARVEPPAWAINDHAQTRRVRARLIEPPAEPNKGTADGANAGAELAPGLMLTVRREQALADATKAGEASSGWAVPRSALVRDERAEAVAAAATTLVFVRAKGGFRPVAVTPSGTAAGDDWIVVSGPLSTDSELASTGVIALKGALLGHGGSE